MSLTHATATRNAIADAVVDRIDLGTGTAAGLLKIRDASNVVLVSLPFSNPAFGSGSGGIATASAVATTNATVAGTASNFIVVDRDGTTIFSGTVTATGNGGDITLTNLSIAVGDPISITSLTYTAAT